jgi:hypothetical protein
MALKTYHVITEEYARFGEVFFKRTPVDAENAKDALINLEIDESDLDQSDPEDVEYLSSLKAEIEYDEKTDRAYWSREESGHAAGPTPEQAAMAYVDLKVEENRQAHGE